MEARIEANLGAKLQLSALTAQQAVRAELDETVKERVSTLAKRAGLEPAEGDGGDGGEGVDDDAHAPGGGGGLVGLAAREKKARDAVLKEVGAMAKRLGAADDAIDTLRRAATEGAADARAERAALGARVDELSGRVAAAADEARAATGEARAQLRDAEAALKARVEEARADALGAVEQRASEARDDYAELSRSAKANDASLRALDARISAQVGGSLLRV